MTPAPRETWQPETRHIGRPVYWFDELDSTNAFARALPAGAAVIADHQTAGRGQYGRTWTSRPGTSLLLSVVLDPPAELRRAVVLTRLGRGGGGGIDPPNHRTAKPRISGRTTCSFVGRKFAES